MSSGASNPSATVEKPASLKRNSEDIGWEYGVLVDPNDLNVIKCKLCPKVVKAGIYRLKLHPSQMVGKLWKLIAETCGVEEVNKLRRSARLNQTREIEDDVHSEHEEEQQIDEEEIEFESGQEDVVTTGYREEEEWQNDD